MYRAMISYALTERGVIPCSLSLATKVSKSFAPSTANEIAARSSFVTGIFFVMVVPSFLSNLAQQ